MPWNKGLLFYQKGRRDKYDKEDIHAFWQSWISQGWFDWEQEGYPFWGNMHHTQTWWNYRHLDNIQFFHYADILANPPGEIKRIAEFLGIDVSDEAISAIGLCVVCVGKFTVLLT